MKRAAYTLALWLVPTFVWRWWWCTESIPIPWNLDPYILGLSIACPWGKFGVVEDQHR